MNKKILLTVAMSIGIFLVMLDTTIMNIALPAIQKGLQIDLTKLSWALNVYTIIFASLTIPLSKLGDIFGKNKLFLLGLFLFGLGSFMAGITTSFLILIVGRVISSLGAALLLPLGNTIGLSAWKIEDRFKIVAILGLTQGGAAAIGPTLGGILTDSFNWHWIFLINLPLVVLGLILCLTTLNFKHEEKRKEKVDISGSLLSMLSLFFITLGLIKVREWGVADARFMTCVFIGVVLFGLFVLVEKKVAFPMIDLQLFKNKNFSLSALVALLAQFFYIGVVVILPTYLTNVFHQSELQAALILLPMSITVFIFGGLGSLAIHKLGPRLLVFIGIMCILMAYLFLANFNGQTKNLLSLVLFILGIGFGIISGPINVLAASNLQGSLLTSSQSIISVVRQIGSVLGVSFFVSNMTGNLTALKTFTFSKINHAYLSIYQIWLPVLALLLLITLAYPKKSDYSNDATIE